MTDLAKIIVQVMDDKDIGVNELSRLANARGFKLSPSTVSAYRRGRIPKHVPASTLDAFAVLLGIPKADLYEAAYGERNVAGVRERASFEESLIGLTDTQQKLVRQLVIELAGSNHKGTHHDTTQPADDTGEQWTLAAHPERDTDIPLDADLQDP
ncbi:helix-turn-helix domain-containing protein [Auritidibacter ignavus]|uniref:helix-turn-helix domain-containing protein n=1 Tax=Auritidibacter ignavus TaxID=678932 RepID=UPI000F3DD4A5|nr:helix-turn-helix transcriptional regulator [Auritidibacter ignavus]NIH70522.1 hypothetical protein [Auritidibacter ignavus]RMX23290.1 XRE family transcriptional regulator [Auritidibacter ignavus]WGH91417.1 helix-turn-helix transcriptional regulator [Auritidibacter ignavus]